jgi:hypothetical protein
MYQIEPIGDVDGDGLDDALIALPGSSYALCRGAATLPTTVAMTWPDSTTSAAAGGFDLDGDGFSDFVVGKATTPPIVFHGAAAGPSVIPNGLSHLPQTAAVAVSDHDGDGRPDFVGVNDTTSDATIQWAGSDGTTNPRAVLVRLPTGVTFSGRLVR